VAVDVPRDIDKPKLAPHHYVIPATRNTLATGSIPSFSTCINPRKRNFFRFTAFATFQSTQYFSVAGQDVVLLGSSFIL